MKKLKNIFIALTIFIVLGCSNGLSKKDIQKMIDDSKTNNTSNGSGTDSNNQAPSSISQIFETALNEVCGKTWKSNVRNTGTTGTKGGWAEAGYDHEIFFNKENFIFSVSLADSGVKGQTIQNNQDYAKFVNVYGAELKDGKLIFKNRLYIRRVYLPKLTKWLSYNQLEDVNGDGTWAMPTDIPAEDPFEDYFKEGAHTGLPNILIDCELEVQTMGTDRFTRNSVDNLSTLAPLRLVIKNGELTMPSAATKIEDKDKQDPANEFVSGYNHLNRLMSNYYSDKEGSTFTCDSFAEFKKDIGKYSNDASGLQAILNGIIAECKNGNKSTLKADKGDFTWGYDVKAANGKLSQPNEIDVIFNPSNILAVKTVEIDNPAFDPSLPESPSNPKKIYEAQPFPALYNSKFQDPENIDKANPQWSNWDKLYTDLNNLTHKTNGSNAYIDKDFDKNKISTVSWEILYQAAVVHAEAGPADEKFYAPAVLTVTRECVDIQDWEDANTELNSSSFKYRSNEVTDGKNKNDEKFDYNAMGNWKEAAHTGKFRKYKTKYTLKLEFKDNASTALWNLLGKKTNIYGNVFECTYDAKTETNEDNWNWVYKIDPYKVAEKFDKKEEWLEFSNVILYGTVTTGRGTAKPETKTDQELNDYFKDTAKIDCATVLNKQSHFFMPANIEKGVTIDAITAIKIVPKHENVMYTVIVDNNSSTAAVDGANTWKALINKDNQNAIDTTQADGWNSFKLKNLNTIDKIAGATITVQLSGLPKNSNINRAGKDRSPSNLRENWNGYSFVIHFGR